MIPNGAHPRADGGRTIKYRSGALRNALLLGTVLGATVIMAAPNALATNYVYTGPASTGSPVVNVWAATFGADQIAITTSPGGTVTNPSGSGVATSAETGAATINLGANVFGADIGVNAYSGTGAITVKIGSGVAVTGTNTDSTGINAFSSGGDLDLGGTAGLGGAVSGGYLGIYAQTTGNGIVNVKTASGAAVTGTGGYGIQTRAADGATTIDVGANVSGKLGGIYAKSTGSSAVKITTGSGGTVTSTSSTTGWGIFVDTPGNIDIGGTAGLGGAVSGPGGIRVQTTDNSTVNIKTALGATVTGTNVWGISTNAVDGATTIDARANVYGGGSNGIAATSETGAITITTGSGVTVTGISDSGIYTYTNGGNIDIGGAAGLGGAVSGYYGIYADTTANGLNPSSNATVNIKTASGAAVTGLSGFGIQTFAENGATAIDVGADVSGKAIGVRATSTGSGSVSVGGAGNVTSTGFAANATQGEGIFVTAVTGGVTVFGTGTTSADGRGISATITGTAATSDILITRSGAVTSGTNGNADASGIYAKNSGGGKVTVSGSGAITASGYGIAALANGGAIELGTEASKLSGVISGSGGVWATNTGTGTIAVRTGASATVTGTSNFGIATFAENGATLVDVGANVSSIARALSIYSGAGAITVKTGSGVTVTSADFTGIDSFSLGGGNIDIGGAAGLGGAVSGGLYGIQATANDNGTINVKTAPGATVAGRDIAGIETLALNGATTINVGGNVSGKAYGISATSNGSGSVSVGGAGNVTSIGLDTGSNGGEGIFATSATGAVAVSGTGNTSATGRGISATITDTAATSDILITRSGPVTSGGWNGTVFTSADAQVGIYAKNSGTGKVTVSGSGAITASGAGIEAVANGGAIELGTEASKLSGAISGQRGIYATNSGTGTVAVRTGTGATVSGTSNIGILTLAADGATTIDLGGNVAGKIIGISSDTSGAGSTSIKIGKGSTVTGEVRAIYAKTNTGNVTVDNAGIIAGSIEAARYSGGTGSLTLNNTGTFKLLGAQANTGFAINNQSGGLLTGTGNFGDVKALSGSFIRPGDRALVLVNGVPQTGTLSLASLTMGPGSTLAVRMDVSGASDKVAVTNAAEVNGANINISASSDDKNAWANVISTKQKYTVLTAGSLTGTFANVTTDLAFLKASADYSTANRVDVTFARNRLGYTELAVTANQMAVATVLEDASEKGGFSTDGRAMLDKFDGSVTTQNAPAALGALSAELVPTMQTTDMRVVNLPVDAVTRRAIAALDGPGGVRWVAPESSSRRAYADYNLMQSSLVPAYADDKLLQAGFMPAYADNDLLQAVSIRAAKAKDAAASQPKLPRTWRVWTAALGGISETSAKNNNPRVTGADFGGVVGFDQMLAPGFIAGVALGSTHSTTSVDGGVTKGSVNANQVSVYAAAETGPAYVSASLGYGRYKSSATRTIRGAGPIETWTADYGSDVFTGDLELGYRYNSGAYRITPFAGVRHNVIEQDAYREKSPDTAAMFGLSYAARQTRSTSASLGLQAEAGLGTRKGWEITGLGRVAWVHEFDANRSIKAAFINLPGTSFTAAGIRADADRGRVTAGVNLVNGRGSTVFATVSGDFSNTTRSGTLQAGFKFEW